MGNLIDLLNSAIDAEYDSKNDELKELFCLPVEERVQKGDTISNCFAYFEGVPDEESFKEYGFSRVKIYCENNISKFREGTPVRLSGNGCSFNLDIIEDNVDHMVLESNWGYNCVPAFYSGADGWQLDNAAVDIRDIVKKSTDILRFKSQKLNLLSQIFEGKIMQTSANGKQNEGKLLAEKTNLNITQKKAFIEAYAANELSLIQGPPGTGKTWLLAHLAVQFAKEGKNVLITANTHTAINNALQKTSTLSKYPHVYKVGKSFQREGLNYNGSTAKNVSGFSIYDLPNDGLGVIVGATCYSPFTKKMSSMNWDVIIFDEAGQLSIPLAFAAMVKGEKYIFIGDHKQLPPIISDKIDNPTFTKSVFEHLFQYYSGIMLDVTYRMNKEINKFPSIQFYDGKLIPHETNINGRLDISNTFETYSDVLDINKPDILYCHFHNSDNTRSEFEAQLVYKLVEEYLKQGVSPSEIAIITPFRAQVRELNKALSQLKLYEDIKDELFVDTIERIQGQERDIVIFSLVTSDPEKAKQRAEFFFNPNRLNVALTRAKKKRIVIGNKSLFEIDSNDYKLNNLIKNFKDFYNSTTIIFEKSDTENLF